MDFYYKKTARYSTFANSGDKKDSKSSQAHFYLKAVYITHCPLEKHKLCAKHFRHSLPKIRHPGKQTNYISLSLDFKKQGLLGDPDRASVGLTGSLGKQLEFPL